MKLRLWHRSTQRRSPLAASQHEHYTMICGKRLNSKPRSHIHVPSVMKFLLATRQWFPSSIVLHHKHTRSSLYPSVIVIEVVPYENLSEAKLSIGEKKMNLNFFCLPFNFLSCTDFHSKGPTVNKKKILFYCKHYHVEINAKKKLCGREIIQSESEI